MRTVDYQDDAGLWRRVQLPDDAPDEHAPLGILVGPPDLGPLKLPADFEIRLHNELFRRKMFTLADAMKPGQLQAAYQAAIGADVLDLQRLYAGEKNGQH